MALECSIGDFQMDVSWNGFKFLVHNHMMDELEMLYNLFDQLKMVERDLKDKNGDGMNTRQGKEFITLMETARGEFIKTLR
jgi:hypothetical protein